MDRETWQVILQTVDVLIKIVALAGGGIWAIRVLREYKYRIQLEVDANLYKLTSPVNIVPFTRFSKERGAEEAKIEPHTHAVEILLKFTNKGRVRFRLYNAQVGINALQSSSSISLDADDGHAHLNRLFTSGHVVPEFPVRGKPVEETSFYYIEPGVEQTIHYLALISEPGELIQIFARFNLEQRRASLEDMITKRGLYPHGAARTFQIGADGRLNKVG